MSNATEFEMRRRERRRRERLRKKRIRAAIIFIVLIAIIIVVAVAVSMKKGNNEQQKYKQCINRSNRKSRKCCSDRRAGTNKYIKYSSRNGRKRLASNR